MIKDAGIKSPLKAILRVMPDYNQKTLEEVESGYCSNPEGMEIMAVRKILEGMVSMGEVQDTASPLLKAPEFLHVMRGGHEEVIRSLKHDGTQGIRRTRSPDHETAVKNKRQQHDQGNCRKAERHKFNDIPEIRKAFMIPDHGNLSENGYTPLTDDPTVHDQCRIVFGELGAYLNSDIGKHMFIAATGNMLAQSGEKLALFQNMRDPEYRKIAFGSMDIGAVFAKHRKPFRKKGMTRKRKTELVVAGTKMILNNTLTSDPYNERVWAEARRA